MMPRRTRDGKWILWHSGTGAMLELWPIDAKGLLASGSHSIEPPEGVVAPPGATDAERGIVEGPGTPYVPGWEKERKSRERQALAAVGEDAPPPLSRTVDPVGLPFGYRLEHVAGGYYHLVGPGDMRIEGPANGKWQGKDAGIAAAQGHAREGEA